MTTFSKAQLKQIIKEEYEAVMDEGDASTDAAVTINQALSQIEDVHKELWGLENIPREWMEQLDSAMATVNQNWEAATGLSEADEGGPGVHDIMNLPEPEAVEPSGNPKEDAFREIVASNSMGKVDGFKMDLFSASAVVKVLDALSPENKGKFLEVPVRKMVQIAFKLLG